MFPLKKLSNAESISMSRLHHVWHMRRYATVPYRLRTNTAVTLLVIMTTWDIYEIFSAHSLETTSYFLRLMVTELVTSNVGQRTVSWRQLTLDLEVRTIFCSSNSLCASHRLKMSMGLTSHVIMTIWGIWWRCFANIWATMWYCFRLTATKILR